MTLSPTREQREAKLEELLTLHPDDEEHAEKEFLRWRALNDLYWFGAELLGLGEGGAAEEGGPPRFDPVFHRWLCDELTAPGSCLILVPRDHLKSTWVTIYLTQQVLRDPETVRAVVISSARDVAQRSISMIIDHLTRPAIMELFGDVIPHPGDPMTFKSWEQKSQHRFTTNRFPHGRGEEEYKAGEAQVQGHGMGTRLTGTHYQLMVLDDIVDPDNVNTPELIQKVKDWLAYALSIMDPHGKLIVIGTRYHFNDAYQTILDSMHETGEDPPMVKRVAMRSCVELPGKHAPVEPDLLDSDSTKPIYAFYTKPMLRKIRADKHRLTRSNYIFNSQYFLTPAAASEKIFPQPWPLFEDLPDDPSFKLYLAVDQAMKSRSTSDPTAIVGAAVNKLGNIYYFHAATMRERPEVVCRAIIELCTRHEFAAIGFEDVAWEAYRYIIFSEWAKWEHRQGQMLRRPPVLQVDVDRGRSKTQRINTRLGAQYRSTKVAIHEELYELRDQMDVFPHGGYDDLVDAADMIIPLAPELSGVHAKLQDRPRKNIGQSVREHIDALRARRQRSNWAKQFSA